MLCNALNAIYFGALKNWDFAYQLLWLYTMQNATDLSVALALHNAKRYRLASSNGTSIGAFIEGDQDKKKTLGEGAT